MELIYSYAAFLMNEGPKNRNMKISDMKNQDKVLKDKRKRAFFLFNFSVIPEKTPSQIKIYFQKPVNAGFYRAIPLKVRHRKQKYFPLLSNGHPSYGSH